MKKTSIITTLLLCLSLSAMAQKTDSVKAKPVSDTVLIPATAKFVKIEGKVYDTRAFKQIPIFLSPEVLEFIVSAMINGKQAEYNATQMQQHVAITQQLQQLLPAKK